MPDRLLSLNDSTITVAIVGCGGFIGCHLLDAVLCRTRWRVLAVDLEFYRVQQHLKDERCEFLSADISDRSVARRVAACPVVINLAAICTPSRYMADAAEVIRSNYNHPALLAEECAKSGNWLVHFSTSEVYGKTAADSGLLVEDETPLTFGPVAASRWSYATAKLLTERYIAGLPDLKWTVVRPFNFVGPFMDFMPGVDGEGIPRVLANFSSALVRGEPLKLVNGGVSRRSFTSVFDAVDFIFALLAAGPRAYSQAFNIGNPDNELSIAELAEKMMQIYADIRGVSVADLPRPVTVSGEEYYGIGYEDSERRLPSVEKAERILGFRARTPIDVVLREALSWFVGHYA